jgi:hypothetical protein
VELTFDPSLPSIETPFAPAVGYTYPRVVLFADFGSNFTTDKNFYVDDIQVCTENTGGDDPMVTFKLNMSQYTGSFTNVYVSGTFNNWSGDALQMTNMGNDMYEASVNIPLGAHEFKFTLDNWANQESFTPTNSCTVSTVDGADIFTNRRLLVTADANYGPVCFNSCYNCGDAVNITYNLGLGDLPVGGGGVFLAGGLEFGAPGGFYKMTPTGSNNMHTITIQRQKGFGGYYTYTNGACADFSCKENIGGQPCAFPNNFNDRFLNAVMQDTVLMQCFGQCETTTNCTSSTNNLTNNSNLTVYPVPTDNIIRWSLESGLQATTELQIVDLTGRILLSQSLPAATSQGTVSLSTLPQGVYILQVKQGPQQASARISKL